MEFVARLLFLVFITVFGILGLLLLLSGGENTRGFAFLWALPLALGIVYTFRYARKKNRTDSHG